MIGILGNVKIEALDPLEQKLVRDAVKEKVDLHRKLALEESEPLHAVNRAVVAERYSAILRKLTPAA